MRGEWRWAHVIAPPICGATCFAGRGLSSRGNRVASYPIRHEGRECLRSLSLLPSITSRPEDAPRQGKPAWQSSSRWRPSASGWMQQPPGQTLRTNRTTRRLRGRRVKRPSCRRWCQACPFALRRCLGPRVKLSLVLVIILIMPIILNMVLLLLLLLRRSLSLTRRRFPCRAFRPRTSSTSGSGNSSHRNEVEGAPQTASRPRCRPVGAMLLVPLQARRFLDHRRRHRHQIHTPPPPPSPTLRRPPPGRNRSSSSIRTGRCAGCHRRL